MSDSILFNCIIVVVSFIVLVLTGIEPVQAMTPSLLLGVFLTLIDIYHELKRRK